MEKTLESPLDCREIQPVHPGGDQSWVFIGRTDVEAETPVLWLPRAKSWLIGKKPWCWEGLRAGGEGDGRRWDGWMASPTRWTWIWVNSGSWWWTGRPGMLRFMGSQRVGHNWVTELNWTPISCCCERIHHSVVQSLAYLTIFRWTMSFFRAFFFIISTSILVWKRKWQYTPVFLPGKSHGRTSLAGYSSWGHKV